MRKIMPCLLLFSLLIMAHAQEDTTQELDADLEAAFNFTVEDDSVNLTGLDMFEVVVSDATQEFNRIASLSHEELERIWLEELLKH